MANHKNLLRAVVFGLLAGGFQPCLAAEISADGRRMKFIKENRGLLIEVVSDDIVHFELTADQASQDVNQRIYTPHGL